jgi:ribose transport system ATP-binding protein
VSLSLLEGEVLALLGETGARKSTLIKILAGVHLLEEGAILFKGRNIGSAVSSLPIAFIHPNLGLIDWITVLENAPH